MATTIPWQCWNAPGFKECHAKQWSDAQRICELASGSPDFPYPDVGTCIAERTTYLALQNCSALCPRESDAAPVTAPSDPIEVMEAGAPRPFLSTTGGRVVTAAAVALVVVMIATWRK